MLASAIRGVLGAAAAAGGTGGWLAAAAATGSARQLVRQQQQQQLSAPIPGAARSVSHAEMTNTFLREVRLLICCSGHRSGRNSSAAGGRSLIHRWLTRHTSWKQMMILFAQLCCPLSLYNQALDQLEYPERLQKLLLTPNREMAVELVVQKDNGARAAPSVACCMRAPQTAVFFAAHAVAGGRGDDRAQQAAASRQVCAPPLTLKRPNPSMQTSHAKPARRDRGLQRVPRAAQQQPRALQGRPALPPGGRPRRRAQVRAAAAVREGGVRSSH